MVCYGMSYAGDGFTRPLAMMPTASGYTLVFMRPSFLVFAAVSVFNSLPLSHVRVPPTWK